MKILTKYLLDNKNINRIREYRLAKYHRDFLPVFRALGCPVFYLT